MENKKTGVIIVVVALFVLFICFFSTTGVEKDGGSEGLSGSQFIVQNAEEESAAVKEDEKKELFNINVDEYLDIYNGSEKKVVLLGSTGCGYCAIAQPIIQNIAYKYDLTIYYLNAYEFSGDDEANFINSNEVFSTGFGTPMLLYVADGALYDTVDGLTDTAGYLEFFKNNGIISE